MPAAPRRRPYPGTGAARRWTNPSGRCRSTLTRAAGPKWGRTTSAAPSSGSSGPTVFSFWPHQRGPHGPVTDLFVVFPPDYEFDPDASGVSRTHPTVYEVIGTPLWFYEDGSWAYVGEKELSGNGKGCWSVRLRNPSKLNSASYRI